MCRAMSAMTLTTHKRLGLKTFDLYALRCRGALELAWAGCDADKVAASRGHLSRAMARPSAGRARQVTQSKPTRANRERTDTAQNKN